jgi:mannose-6-phosphate isomerase-like protein (cupin superfamily)
MAEPGRLRVRRAAELEPRVVRGMTVRALFRAEEGGFASDFGFALLNSLPPGGANEPHVHEDVEKVYYVVAGEGLVRCGEDEARVSAGDAFFLPVNVQHSVTNTGADELRMAVLAVRVRGNA